MKKYYFLNFRVFNLDRDQFVLIGIGEKNLNKQNFFTGKYSILRKFKQQIHVVYHRYVIVVFANFIRYFINIVHNFALIKKMWDHHCSWDPLS